MKWLHKHRKEMSKTKTETKAAPVYCNFCVTKEDDKSGASTNSATPANVRSPDNRRFSSFQPLVRETSIPAKLLQCNKKIKGSCWPTPYLVSSSVISGMIFLIQQTENMPEAIAHYTLCSVATLNSLIAAQAADSLRSWERYGESVSGFRITPTQDFQGNPVVFVKTGKGIAVSSIIQAEDGLHFYNPFSREVHCLPTASLQDSERLDPMFITHHKPSEISGDFRTAYLIFGQSGPHRSKVGVKGGQWATIFSPD